MGLVCHQSGKVSLKLSLITFVLFRFICGTQDIHKDLEDKISKFHGREDSILYPSCFDANAGLFEQICGPEVW
jgi:glycine C-acetyltransferase